MPEADQAASARDEGHQRDNRPFAGNNASFAVLGAVSLAHFLNDLIQSLISAVYPIFKDSFQLDYAQVGLIAAVFQIAASVFQPLVGYYTDRHPSPFAVCIGLGVTLIGLLTLAFAPTFAILLIGVTLVGLGASVFHPESSKIARLASGKRYGFAESVFQLGGTTGSACGPLMAAFVVFRFGQQSIGWFSLAVVLAIGVSFAVGRWYQRHIKASVRVQLNTLVAATAVSPRLLVSSFAILFALVFANLSYLASFTTYYTLYLIDKFGLSIQSAQIHLFVFLTAVAAGTFIGGPIADRIGRTAVISGSVLGPLPFTLALPHANLFWTMVLTVPIGVIFSSAFPTIIVYARELVPGRVGMIGGAFYGIAFAVTGVAALGLGKLADLTSIHFVYQLCAVLPAVGILSFFLPATKATPAQPQNKAANVTAAT